MEEIKVEHLTKDYGHGRGVFDVSFVVNKGEVFGFLGPNGAGKSTTIRHLMGFSKPDVGKTQILGQDSFQKYFDFMGKVGYLPGEIALPAGLTGYEFIDMMKKLKRVNNDEWLKHLIELFELDPSGETKRMSLGVKRKLAVVTAFMNDPDILILDEDDLVAIITRKLMDGNRLFNEERLLLSQTKSISKNDRKSFTNIQTLYDCNYLLLKLYIYGHDLYINVNDRKKKVSFKKKSDLIEFLKFRRDDLEIEEFYLFVNNFWNKFSKLKPIDMFLNPKGTDFKELFLKNNEYIFDGLFLRGPISDDEKTVLDNIMNQDTYYSSCYKMSMYPFKEGGNILYRPFGLISVINVICELIKKTFKLEDIIKRLNFIDLSLSYNIWNDIIYKISDDRMITSNKKLFEEILMYLLYPEIYEEELVSSLCNKISVFWINSNELKEKLDSVDDSDKVKVENEYKINILSKIKNLLLSSNYLGMYKEWKGEKDIND